MNFPQARPFLIFFDEYFQQFFRPDKSCRHYEIRVEMMPRCVSDLRNHKQTACDHLPRTHPCHHPLMTCRTRVIAAFSQSNSTFYAKLDENIKRAESTLPTWSSDIGWKIGSCDTGLSVTASPSSIFVPFVPFQGFFHIALAYNAIEIFLDPKYRVITVFPCIYIDNL